MEKKAGFGYLLFLLFVYIPLLALVRGYTAAVLWGWFAPIAGMPRLPIAAVLGFSFALSALMTTKDTGDSDDDGSPWGSLAGDAIYWLLFCAILLGEAKILLLVVG